MRGTEIIMNALTGIMAVSALAMVATVQRDHSAQRLALVADTTPKRIADWDRYASSGHRLGVQQAKVTIVEFGDFQCPACGHFFNAVERFRAKHPAEVALVFHHLPLPYHQFAYASARAAECAGVQGRFEAMYSALYRAQDSLGRRPFSRYAALAGVPDSVAFQQCMATDQLQPTIEADIASSRKLGVRGTPGVVVNGMLFNVSPTEKRLEEILAVTSRHQRAG